jgi:transposase
VGNKRVKRYRAYTEAFRKAAVERMKNCPNVGALADELGVHRRLLYNWRDQALADPDPGCGETSAERKLSRQNAQLKRLLAEKTLEVDFFRGALQKVEARRRRSSAPGETASTTESGS